MNMTSSFLKAKKETVKPEINTKYRIVFINRPYGFIDGAIYEVIGLFDGYVKLKGYKLTFLEKTLNFYPIN